MSRRAQHRRPPQRHWWHAAGLAAVGAMALATTIGVTWASFHDENHVAMSDLSSGSQIGLIDHSGGGEGTAVQVGLSTTGYQLTVADADAHAFVPGATARADLHVFNNGTTLPVQLTTSLASINTAADDVADDLRVSARVTYDSGTTETLFGTPDDPGASTVTLASASATTTGVLAGRGTAPLAEGATWTPGAADSTATITVWLHLLDTARDGQSSASSAVRIMIGSESQ